jgi:hypothetical protein
VMPRLELLDGCTRLVVDSAPFVILGAEVNNSSASDLRFMAPVWERLKGYHCNTVLVPVSWELVEPREGERDFSLVDGMVSAAREHGLRLVLLWFGTWKNGVSQYVPSWVKTDLQRFPRARDAAGRNTRMISPFSAECRTADARCYAALMGHLKEIDSGHGTVVAVQVQNETGIIGPPRDCGPEANAAFTAPVPEALCSALAARRASLRRDFRVRWEAAGALVTGTWPQVFGDMASEVFMAWHLGRYVEAVCASGKAEYPLPMYANAWLDYGAAPGTFPSGGPLTRLHDVWRAAAPSIDLLAPDIYVKDFKRVCEDFHQGGNPLFIPEANAAGGECNVFWAIAEHDALGFSPFGFECAHPWFPELGDDKPALREAFGFLASMMPLITRMQGTGRMRGILQTDNRTEILALGDYRLEISWAGSAEDEAVRGRGLVVDLGQGEYLVAGRGFALRFLPPEGNTGTVDFLSLEEGWFVDGTWVPARRLNGDDTFDFAVRIVHEQQLCARKVKLYSYD